MNKRYQVFVSSTYTDLIEYRQLVIKSLMQIDALPAGMESFPAADEDAWSIIKRVIDQSDYYLVIIGGRYGSTNAAGVGYTELEYDYAESQKKPIMAFLHSSPERLPREATETDPAKWEKLAAFRKKAERRHCKYWSTKEELILYVLTSYPHMVANYPAPGWVRGDQAKTVAEMERLAFLERKVAEQEEELRKARERKAEEDDTSFLGGDDDVAVRGYSTVLESEYIIHTTWNRLFVLAGTHIIMSSPREDSIRDAIIEGLQTTSPEMGHIGDQQLGLLKSQFVALGLITIEHLPYTQISSWQSEQRSEQKMLTTWKLTDKGVRRLGSLIALRRPAAPAVSPSNAAEPSVPKPA